MISMRYEGTIKGAGGASGIRKINRKRLSGFFIRVKGDNAKGIDGEFELYEYGKGTVVKLTYQDALKLTKIIYGDPIVNDPTDTLIYLPVVLEQFGARDFNGEIRISLPDGYDAFISSITGNKPAHGVIIESLNQHLAAGRNRVDDGINGRAVQMIVIDANFETASLKTLGDQIVSEGSDISLRGINTVFFTPETPTNDAILPAIGNTSDKLYLDITTTTEQDTHFIIISALNILPSPHPIPAPPSRATER